MATSARSRGMLLTARWDGGKDWRGGRGPSLYGGPENSRSRKNKRDGAWVLGFQVEWGGDTSPDDVAGAGFNSGGPPHVAKTGLRTSASSAVHFLSSKGSQGIKSAIITPTMLKEPGLESSCPFNFETH